MMRFVKTALKSFPRPMLMLKDDSFNLHNFEDVSLGLSLVDCERL